MRISDWSSDVCSSDLLPYETLRARTSPTVTCAARLTCLVSSPSHFGRSAGRFGRQALGEQKSPRSHRDAGFLLVAGEIGRASCRGRVWKFVLISVVAVSLKKKEHKN